MSAWTDCERCGRCTTKTGVFAPVWSQELKVLVVTPSASRLSQAISAPDADSSAVAAAIRESFGLRSDEVGVDTLGACGRGLPTADEVAACGERFSENLMAASPTHIVLLGRETERLATASGYLVNGQWRALGVPGVDTIVALDASDAVRRLAATGKYSSVPGASRGLGHLAPHFLGVLGQAEGRAIRIEGRWKREPKKQLEVADVQAHLDGGPVVAAFRPRGAWPFVVIDVDVHNAVQLARIDDTMAALRTAFPNSFFVQSSGSGGMHVYVRLPPDTRYDNAALWLRGFLVAKGLRFVRLTGANSNLRSELTEVPSHPPRLPFGIGSRIPKNALPLVNQAIEFLNWANSSSGALDFQVAVDFTREHFAVAKRWSRVTRDRLKRKVELAESGADLSSEVRLSQGDPWAPILASLPKKLRGVAASGISSYGSRTSWTLALISEISRLVDEDQAQILMEYWLSSRTHASEDWEHRPEKVFVETRALVRRRYKSVRGIPVRLWTEIEAEVRLTMARIQVAPSSTSSHARAAAHLEENAVLATAFFVARGFFNQGRTERRIAEWEFAQYVGRNDAHNMQAVLTEGQWLSYTKSAVPGVAARTFFLNLRYWPPWPLEPTLVIPPFSTPRRRER